MKVKMDGLINSSFPGIRKLTLGLSVIALAGLMVSCKKSETAHAVQVAVEAASATQEPITEHVTADAILSPVEQAAIVPKIVAPVKKFYVQRGMKVKAGQLLATLENSDLDAAVLDNRGAFDAAQAGYETVTKAQIPEDYQKANLDLAQAQANLDLNKKIVASRKELFQQGAIPGRDLDTAQAALVQANAAFESAQKHLSSMQQVSREAALKSAKGQLESAKGKYEGATAQKSYSEIRSPIAGVVTDRSLFAGETPAAGVPLITVMDTSVMLAKTHLSQLQAQILHVGDPATVHVPGLDDDIEGKISVVSPALDPGSTTVEVWVKIANPGGQLRAGTAVHISLSGKRIANALVVPAESIVVTSGGKKAVMLIGADGAVHQKEVETGVEDNGKVQILSGVSAGQKVVTRGAYALDDGTRVNVVASLKSNADDDSAKPAAGDDK